MRKNKRKELISAQQHGNITVLNNKGQFAKASDAEQRAFNERKKLFMQPFGEFKLVSAAEIAHPRTVETSPPKSNSASNTGLRSESVRVKVGCHKRY